MTVEKLCPYCNKVQPVTPYEKPVGAGRYFALCPCGKRSRAGTTIRDEGVTVEYLTKMGREPGKWKMRPGARYLRLAVSAKLTAKQAQIILDNYQDVV